MVKVSRAPKRDNNDIHDETHPVGERHEITSLPNGDKLLAYAEEFANPAVNAMQIQTNSAAAPTPKRFTAVDAAREAGSQIESLVRMKVDSVSAVSRSEDGWEVVVNVVELARIPHSTDVLASYNVHLDMEGCLVSYDRGNRYTRGQTGDVM